MDHLPRMTEEQLLVRADELKAGMVVDEPDGWRGTVASVVIMSYAWVELEDDRVRPFNPTRMIHVERESYEY